MILVWLVQGSAIAKSRTAEHKGVYSLLQVQLLKVCLLFDFGFLLQQEGRSYSKPRPSKGPDIVLMFGLV